MEKEGSESGTEKAEKHTTGRDKSRAPSAQVVRVEDLHVIVLVEGLVEKALAARTTTESPPTDTGGKYVSTQAGGPRRYMF